MSAFTIDAERFREFERHAHDQIADSYHSFFVPITEHAAAKSKGTGSIYWLRADFGKWNSVLAVKKLAATAA